MEPRVGKAERFKMPGFCRRFAAAILAAGAVIATTCVARAQSENAAITYHGVEFPAAFADDQRIGTRDYESMNPVLGFSAAYRHRGATSTVYIYDARVTSIPDDISAAVVAQQFEESKSDIRSRSQSERAILKRKSTFAITDAGGRPRLTCEDFDLRRSDTPFPLDTYVCVGVANAKFFKVRTTMPQREDSQGEVRRFMGAWVAKLWKS